MSQANPHNQADHEMAAALLDRLFTGEQTAAGLGGERVLEVQRHIASCDACRGRFDELAVADRALLGRDEDGRPGDFEREFRDASVMGAIDALLEEEQGLFEEQSTEQSGADGGAEVVELPGRSSRWQRLAMPLAAAAALLLIAGAGVWISSDVDPLAGGDQPGVGSDQFQPRTASPPARSSDYRKPSIELFCARDVGDDVQFQGSADAPFGLLSCPKDSRIKFGYQSTDPKLRHAAFFGVDRAGTIYWYGPSPAREESWQIQSRPEITPVGETVELGVNHAVGDVRVYGLFSPEPIDFDEMDRMLSRADESGLFESGEFDERGFEGAWATETFEVVEEGER